jgi:hypothetical protein
MNIALEIHLGFAFFVFLIALFIGWVQLGRGVVVTVIAIQFLIGIAVAAIAGSTHQPLPGTLWLHIGGAVLALLAYAAGRRIFDGTPRGARAAFGLSFLGFVLVIFTIWYGSHVTLTHGL